jgi:hypothetical protein
LEANLQDLLSWDINIRQLLNMIEAISFQENVTADQALTIR